MMCFSKAFCVNSAQSTDVTDLTRVEFMVHETSHLLHIL